MPIAYSANADFRLFFNRLFKDFGTHYDVTQTVTDQDYDFSAIPDSWEYFYIPEYVPEGYKVDGIKSDKHKIEISYKLGTSYIYYRILNDEETTNSLDSEHAEVVDVKIKNKVGHFIYDPSGNTLIWHDEPYSFRIMLNDSNIDDNDLLKMAESLKIMSK